MSATRRSIQFLRRWFAPLALIFSALALTATPKTGVPLHIIAKQSGLYMDVSNVSRKPGEKIHQWTLTNAANQMWILEKAGDAFYLESVHSGLYLTVEDASTEQGARLVQMPKTGNAHQRFKILPAGDDHYYLVAAHSEMVVEVGGFSRSKGGAIQQYSKTGADNQQWSFKPTEVAKNSRTVRFIYMVSKDRRERKDYKQAIEHAARDIQKWYGQQLGGPTFRLNDPVVEVVRSREKAAWFYANPNGGSKDSWGFNNTLAEAKRLLGARQSDPNYIWVIYSDGPGNKGRGGGGVCIMPEDDLLGLVGEHPTQKDVARWIAGLGHELGHAFGLGHPPDTKKDNMAIMWAGIYGGYPDKTYFTKADKERLLRHPFIREP